MQRRRRRKGGREGEGGGSRGELPLCTSTMKDEFIIFSDKGLHAKVRKELCSAMSCLIIYFISGFFDHARACHSDHTKEETG